MIMPTTVTMVTLAALSVVTFLVWGIGLSSDNQSVKKVGRWSGRVFMVCVAAAVFFTAFWFGRIAFAERVWRDLTPLSSNRVVVATNGRNYSSYVFHVLSEDGGNYVPLNVDKMGLVISFGDETDPILFQRGRQLGCGDVEAWRNPLFFCVPYFAGDDIGELVLPDDWILVVQ